MACQAACRAWTTSWPSSTQVNRRWQQATGVLMIAHRRRTTAAAGTWLALLGTTNSKGADCAGLLADILARKIANDNSVDRGVGSPYCK